MMFLPGGLTFWLHVIINILFNMKTIIGKIFITMLIISSVGSLAAAASPVTFPGEFWGKLDRNTLGDTHGQYDITQGAKVRAFPYLIPYVGITHYQQFGDDTKTFFKYGVKTEILNPFVLGIEKEHFLYSTTPINDSVVAYISLYKGWEFGK